MQTQSDIRPWAEVRAGDFVAGNDGIVYQVLAILDETIRTWNPEHGMAVFPRPKDSTVEIVMRGDTGVAIDNFKAAGFAVGIIREDPSEPWKP